jgi:hypothetical protein
MKPETSISLSQEPAITPYFDASKYDVVFFSFLVSCETESSHYLAYCSTPGW